jgi:RecB family endonuclease NucS
MAYKTEYKNLSFEELKQRVDASIARTGEMPSTYISAGAPEWLYLCTVRRRDYLKVPYAPVARYLVEHHRNASEIFYTLRQSEDQSVKDIPPVDDHKQPLLAEASVFEVEMETTFALERDLQSVLCANLGQLEEGLIVSGGGREYQVPSGRIDILAKDSQDRLVVIELKAGTADRDAIGQIQSYMGDLQTDDSANIRGILVAGDFTPRAIAAAKVVPNIALRKYIYNFRFERVGK